MIDVLHRVLDGKGTRSDGLMIPTRRVWLINYTLPTSPILLGDKNELKVRTIFTFHASLNGEAS